MYWSGQQLSSYKTVFLYFCAFGLECIISLAALSVYFCLLFIDLKKNFNINAILTLQVNGGRNYILYIYIFHASCYMWHNCGLIRLKAIHLAVSHDIRWDRDRIKQQKTNTKGPFFNPIRFSEPCYISFLLCVSSWGTLNYPSLF